MGSKPKTPKVPPMNIAGDIRKYVQGFQAELPTILGAEAQYRPQFQGLNLGDISAFLGGVGGQQGLYGLGATATAESQRQLQAAREAEMQGMLGQTGLFRQFAQGLAPEAQAQVDAATRAAQQAYQTAEQRQLTPQEQRMATQQSREAFGQRGMLGSTGSVAGEILNRDMYRQQVQAQARQEAAQRGSEAFNLAQQFYTAPGLSALSSAPLSYSAGQQQLGLGLGAIGAGTPQLFDIGTALNLGAAQRQNIVNAQAAGAQASAARSAGLMGGLGSAFGGLMQGAGAAGGLGALFALSDKRVKTNIKRVGKTDGGLPVYTYKYKGSNTTQMGVMAQDVEKKKPNAVKEFGGLKAVNYAMVK